MLINVLNGFLIGFLILYGVILLSAFIFAYRLSKSAYLASRWIYSMIFDLLVQVLSRVLFNFIACLFVDKTWNIRIKWMKRIFQTPDSTMNGGGLNGNRTRNETLGGTGGDQGFYDNWMKWYNEKPSFIRRYIISWMWVQRNCSQGFGVYVVGLYRDRTHRTEIEEHGDYLKVIAYNKDDKPIGFEYKNKKYFFGRGDCRLGYKIKAWQEYCPAQVVYRFRPY